MVVGVRRREPAAEARTRITHAAEGRYAAASNDPMADLAKVVPLLGIFMLPGGCVLLPLAAKMLPVDLFPSAFSAEPEPEPEPEPKPGSELDAPPVEPAHQTPHGVREIAAHRLGRLGGCVGRLRVGEDADEGRGGVESLGDVGRREIPE